MTKEPPRPRPGARPEPAKGGEDGVLLLRVVRGEPTAEELAALTVVVATLGRRPPRRRPTPVGAWAAHADRVRRPLQIGPGGWRAAGRPS